MFRRTIRPNSGTIVCASPCRARHHSTRGAEIAKTSKKDVKTPFRHALLVVEEDSPEEALAVEGLLRSGLLGEVEVIRHSGQSIANLLSPGGVSPSLIVLDMSDPSTSALPILRELRSHEHTRYVPVVMLSPEQPEDVIRACLDSGADVVVPKPPDAAVYVEHVTLIAQSWLSLDERPQQNIPTHKPSHW